MLSAHACVCTHRNPTAAAAADMLLQPLMAPSLILAWTAQLLLFEFPSPPPQSFTSHHCQRTDWGTAGASAPAGEPQDPVRMNGLVPVKASGPSPPSTQLRPHREGDISHGGCQRLSHCLPPRVSLLSRWAMFAHLCLARTKPTLCLRVSSGHLLAGRQFMWPCRV